MPTHEVFNQSTPLVDYNLYTSDSVLAELVSRFHGGWAGDRLVDFGSFAGSAQAQQWALQANENPPELHTFNRFGQRIDEVEYHPAYHELMRASIANSLHALPWQEPQPGAHVARAALMYMAFQNESGHCCPVSMTYSVVPSLRMQPDLAAIWVPRLLSNNYDGRFVPAELKTGATMGMGMTEKQGGSDIRANTTRAVPVDKRGGGMPYLLTGHKWFTSAPMSDAFLVLAQTEKGVSCFFVPRFRPDGSKNNLFIQRLKDKMGNRSNASSELEFENTFGILVGEEGRGVPTIIEMVNHTRLDCIIGAAALMRQATMQAMHHCHQRAAFGRKLSQQPLMRNVLADLALESEAAARLMMAVAGAYDDEQQAAFKRIASAVVKFWTCKRAPMHVAEALECFGGNGYVNEGPMPRLFTESPLLGIWEGSGNVISLDILRAATREPDSVDALVQNLRSARGFSSRLDGQVKQTERQLLALLKAVSNGGAERREAEMRRLAERLALVLQANLMAAQAPAAVADAFIASRLGAQGYHIFGTLPATTPFQSIIERAYTLR